MPQLTPSVTRSALVQQLLAQSQRNQGRGSRSFAESAAIAAAPVVAALLGRQEEVAQKQQQQHIGGVQSALANALTGGSDLRPGQQGPTLDRANPASIAAGLLSLDPENSLGQFALTKELNKDIDSLQRRAAEADIALTEARTDEINNPTRS